MEADRENDGEFDDDNKSKCGVTNAHDHSTNYISSKQSGPACIVLVVYFLILLVDKLFYDKNACTTLANTANTINYWS